MVEVVTVTNITDVSLKRPDQLTILSHIFQPGGCLVTAFAKIYSISMGKIKFYYEI